MVGVEKDVGFFQHRDTEDTEFHRDCLNLSNPAKTTTILSKPTTTIRKPTPYAGKIISIIKFFW